MGSFFANPYMLYGGDFNPNQEEEDPELAALMSGMQSVDFPEDPAEQDMGPPTPGGIQPRMIPPHVQGYARPGFETYLQHIRSMPQESDYDPSTGRKIMAAVVGGLTGLSNPAAGYAAAEKIVRTPYERALSDWQVKGKELGSLATEEGKYIGNLSEETVAGGKLGAKYAELDAKRDQINKNYEVASKNAKTAEEKVQLQKQRDADLKALGDERNRIEAINAGANVTRAGAAVTAAGAAATNAKANETRANAYGEYTGALGAGKIPKPADVNDSYNAEQDVLMELMSTNPEYRLFFDYDKASGTIIPKMNEDFDEEQLALREALMARVGIETQKRLGGYAAQGAPPLWRMRPDVIIPPDKRRRP